MGQEKIDFRNPFRPGAGHMPPYLAGRDAEMNEFKRLLKQDVILENLILTGLRGVGKTVLLETFKPAAIQENWLWVSADFSESLSVSEENLAIRIVADISIVTSTFSLTGPEKTGMGFNSASTSSLQPVNYEFLIAMYQQTPGMVADKLKAVLEFSWSILKSVGRRGLIFAYDEAQNLSDNASKDQFPLSVLLDVFQSIQRKNIPFMLALSGLPTLFPKLVEARTYSERMFRIVLVDKLNRIHSAEAIKKPIQLNDCPVEFSDDAVEKIADISGGYPYFIQFICREVYDIWIQQNAAGDGMSIPVTELTRKLDTDFFAGRWARVTDRQRELLWVISSLPNADMEFTVLEVVESSGLLLEKGFSSSHANQILVSLSNSGLVYKNRHGKYSFAVPLMSQFVKRHWSGI